jgi:hypothetical protein
MQSATLAISLSSILIQVVTLRIMIKRKQRREFPSFFRYTAYSACTATVLAAALFVFTCNCREYYYLYWACTFPLLGLQFGVMYESFVNALKPYSALIDLGKMLFRWAGVFLLLAALLSGFASHGQEGTRILSAEHVIERILALMQCGLLLLFFVFERKLGLAWRSYSMAIALGLGILAATDLSTSYIQAAYPAWSPILGFAANFAYLSVVSFWAVCFRQVEPTRKNVLDSPSRLIFQRWNEALSGHGYGKPAGASSVESFLPGIEKTVERVMARSIH